MVVGAVSPRDRDIIVDSIKVAGTALSWKFSAPAFSRDAVDASVGCLNDKAPWSCIPPTVRTNEQLVIVEIDSERVADAPMTIVTAHVLASGTESDSTDSRYCEMCNEDALKRAVGELGRTLLQNAAERTRRTKLAIHSSPSRAWILLDGKPVGITDLTRATFPGKHTISFLLQGYRTETRDVVVVEDKTLDVSVELKPEASAPTDAGDHGQRPGLPPRFFSKLAIGAGGAAMLAGGLLIAFDQDPDPHGPQSRYYYNTAGLGVATLGVGALVAGAGIYFLTRPHVTSTATVTALPGGGAIGWAARF
jgi:PEGA domain